MVALIEVVDEPGPRRSGPAHVAPDAAARPMFPAGSTVVRRDTLGGKVFSAIPYRVIRDTGTELVMALWPGVELLGPTTWIEWLRTGDAAVRKPVGPVRIATRACGRTPSRGQGLRPG